MTPSPSDRSLEFAGTTRTSPPSSGHRRRSPVSLPRHGTPLDLDHHLELHYDDDVLRLDDLSEGNLVVALERRFLETRRVYTRAGTILIAINPYEWDANLYSAELMDCYRAQSEGTPAGARNGDVELPPHLFETAAMVHAALKHAADGSRQTIIISGESGAGKVTVAPTLAGPSRRPAAFCLPATRCLRPAALPLPWPSRRLAGFCLPAARCLRPAAPGS